MGIDWKNEKDAVSAHFSVRDMIWLPSWGRLANESDGLDDTIKANLIELANKMETVRQLTGNRLIRSHVAYRSPQYNAQIGGAPHSAHRDGRAMDFDVVGLSCDDARAIIVPALGMLKMRCEDNPGSLWVHLGHDFERQPTYFKP